jgi:ankyrin repeat protein
MRRALFALLGSVLLILSVPGNCQQSAVQKRFLRGCWTGSLDSVKAVPLGESNQNRHRPMALGASEESKTADDVRNAEGATPLHLAAGNGDVELFAFLQQKNPSLLKKNPIRQVERAGEAYEVDKRALLVPGEQVRDTIISEIRG